MSKRFVAFALAMALTMTVGGLALFAPDAQAGQPANLLSLARCSLVERCADCPQTIAFPNGWVCNFTVCVIGDPCNVYQYSCQF